MTTDGDVAVPPADNSKPMLNISPIKSMSGKAGGGACDRE